MLDSISRWCFSAEGKARLEYGRQKHLASFESVYRTEEPSLHLAFDISLYGEEDLWIKRNLKTKKVSVGGSLLSKIKNELGKNHKFEMSFLMRGIHRLSLLKSQKLSINCRSEGQGLQCQSSEFEWKYRRQGERNAIIQTSSRGSQLILETFVPGRDYFERMTLYAKDKSNKEWFKIEFFLSECGQKDTT